MFKQTPSFIESFVCLHQLDYCLNRPPKAPFNKHANDSTFTNSVETKNVAHFISFSWVEWTRWIESWTESMNHFSWFSDSDFLLLGRCLQCPTITTLAQAVRPSQPNEPEDIAAHYPSNREAKKRIARSINSSYSFWHSDANIIPKCSR